MKYIVIKFGIFLINILYTFIKFLPLKKRVVFISRQSNKESEDILLLKISSIVILTKFEISKVAINNV